MRVGLNFGLSLSEFTPEQITIIARDAERLGFNSIWHGDHLILPPVIPLRDMSQPDLPVWKVVPSEHSRVIFPPTAPMPDVLSLFIHMAAATSRLAFGTDIYILALRDSMAVARQAATVDWLSGGRLSLGIGLGWLPGEYAAAGISWSDRVGRTEESIEVMRRLWNEDEVSHQGKHFSYGPAVLRPRPARTGGPPILIGGESDAAMRRAARLGDGWCARFQTPDTLTHALAKIEEERRSHGQVGPFEVVVDITREATVDDLHALERVGATGANVGLHWLTDFDQVRADMAAVSLALNLLG